MSELNSEKTAESTEKHNPILDIDLKDWLRNPVTQMYFSVYNAISNKSLEEATRYMDHNVDQDAETLKLVWSRGYAQREIISLMIDGDTVLQDFKEAKLILEEK